MTEARIARGYSFPKLQNIIVLHTPTMWGWLNFFNTFREDRHRRKIPMTMWGSTLVRGTWGRSNHFRSLQMPLENLERCLGLLHLDAMSL
jgi:hypothetical protein